MDFPAEVEDQLLEYFQGRDLEDAHTVLRPLTSARVAIAVILLSQGDFNRLRHFAEVAQVDSRDVLYWAENPPADGEPASFDELQERLRLPPP